MKQFRMITFGLLLTMSAQAGILQIAVAPIRHPKKAAKVVWWPIRHPWKALGI